MILVYTLLPSYRFFDSFPTRRSSDLDQGRRDFVGLVDITSDHRHGVRGGAEHSRAERDIYEPDRKSTRLNSSHANISYAVFSLKKKKTERNRHRNKPNELQ